MIINRLQHAIDHCRGQRHFTTSGAGFIYFIECEGFVKVGLTKNHVNERVESLQIGCPFELTLLKVMVSRDTKRDEGLLHDVFGVYWHRGEWFKLPSELMERIAVASCINDLSCAAAPDWQI